MTNPDDDAFRQAVTAIDAGNVEQLQRLLEAHPWLASDRLTETPDWLLVVAGADPLRPDSAWHGTALEWAEHYVENSSPQRTLVRGAIRAVGCEVLERPRQ